MPGGRAAPSRLALVLTLALLAAAHVLPCDAHFNFHLPHTWLFPSSSGETKPIRASAVSGVARSRAAVHSLQARQKVAAEAAAAEAAGGVDERPGASFASRDAKVDDADDAQEHRQAPSPPPPSPPPPPPSPPQLPEFKAGSLVSATPEKQNLVAGAAALEVEVDTSTHQHDALAAAAIANSGQGHNVKGHAESLDKGKIVFTTFATEELVDLLANWVAHAMAAGLPNVVVIALDAAVLQWCAARAVTAIDASGLIDKAGMQLSVKGYGLPDARHVIGCHLTQETRVQNALS